MSGITTAQARCLRFIADYTAQHDGVAPCYTEICKHLEIKSKGEVHRLVQQLIDRGMVRHIPTRARSLEVVAGVIPPASHMELAHQIVRGVIQGQVDGLGERQLAERVARLLPSPA